MQPPSLCLQLSATPTTRLCPAAAGWQERANYPAALMPAESQNAKHAAGDGSGFWNDRVNLHIVEIGMITSGVVCSPSETDFYEGVGCVTSSTYVKSVKVVQSVGVRYRNQAFRCNGKAGAAICAVADFHLAELPSISDARKRKTK
jgi:hypothetical protein